ncbi:MAG: aspartate/glutamate racemase family protein [Eubacteriales bacterium]
MKNKFRKTVGIMGGMGPLATADLFCNIIAQTDASRDADHVHIIIDSDPSVPDRTEAILHGGISPLPRLREMAQRLEKMGADMIAVSCNTSHYFYNEICAAVDIPVINMIDETAAYIAQKNYREVLLLATDATIGTGVYSKYLNGRGISVNYLDFNGQKQVMQLIYDCVKAGNYDFDIESFKDRLNEQCSGGQPVVLGCTELPVAFRKFGLFRYNTIDPSVILARAIVRESGCSLVPEEQNTQNGTEILCH